MKAKEMPSFLSDHIERSGGGLGTESKEGSSSGIAYFQGYGGWAGSAAAVAESFVGRYALRRKKCQGDIPFRGNTRW